MKAKINVRKLMPGELSSKWASKWTAGTVLLAALAACGQASQKLIALEPNNDTACALDGMVLKDYAGPKAQIHYAEGKPEFFCDLTELFSVVLLPEHKRAITAIFVQDMGKTDWAHPQANWIDAKTAVYVIGSRKHGSMGPAYGSFSSMHDAEAFVRQEGGKILQYEQIGTGVVSMNSMKGEAAHDTH